jgi:hypothetical protein
VRLNPAGSISLTNLQPNQKVIQKIVVTNNSRETNEITIDSSQLSKIQLSSNCDSELVSRKK